MSKQLKIMFSVQLISSGAETQYKKLTLNILLTISNGVMTGLDDLVDLTSLKATEKLSFNLLELLFKWGLFLLKAKKKGKMPLVVLLSMFTALKRKHPFS